MMFNETDDFLDNLEKLIKIAWIIKPLIRKEHQELLHHCLEHLVCGDYAIEQFAEFVALYDKIAVQLAKELA